MKTKIKLKLMVVFSIMLLSVLTLNINTTNAAANASSLNDIPETIYVEIPTTEAIEDGFMSQKLGSILQEEVMKAINDEEIKSEQVIIEFSGEKLLDVAKINIKLYDSASQNELIAQKTVKIMYHDKWNTVHYNYVKEKLANLTVLDLKDLKIDFDDEGANIENVEKVIEEGFSKLINDETIECKFYSQMGLWAYPNFFTIGILTFSKNGVVYYTTTSTEGIYATATMTVPETVEETEEAYIEYAISKLKTLEHFKDVELRMEKEEKENTYSLYEGDSKDPTFIIMNKEVKNVPVEETDKETNIKLETTGTVVPANTKLEVKKIEEGSVLETVKKVLSNVKNMKVFDITLTSNNQKIQPNGKVKIYIPIPNGMSTENLMVYRVTDDSKKIEYKPEVKEINGVKYAIIETDHFSTYVLAELVVTEDKKDETTTTGVVKEDKLDNTPATGNKVDLTNVFSLLAIMSFVCVTVLIKK